MRYEIILTVESPAPVFTAVAELESAICRGIGDDGELSCSVSGREDFSFHIRTRSPDTVIAQAKQVLRQAGFTAFKDRYAEVAHDWDAERRDDGEVDAEPRSQA